jgi:hypothetical protein
MSILGSLGVTPKETLSEARMKARLDEQEKNFSLELVKAQKIVKASFEALISSVEKLSSSTRCSCDCELEPKLPLLDGEDQ